MFCFAPAACCSSRKAKPFLRLRTSSVEATRSRSYTAQAARRSPASVILRYSGICERGRARLVLRPESVAERRARCSRSALPPRDPAARPRPKWGGGTTPEMRQGDFERAAGETAHLLLVFGVAPRAAQHGAELARRLPGVSNADSGEPGGPGAGRVTGRGGGKVALCESHLVDGGSRRAHARAWMGGEGAPKSASQGHS